MSNDWDFYPCRVDDLLASIFLDLGIAQEAPISNLPVMAYVRIAMQSPRNDGLSSQAEFETLNAIEDSLAALQSHASTIFVGRNTSDGWRDHYFYLDTPAHWDERVANAMQKFPTYEFMCDTRDDPEWSTYFEFLYPAAKERQHIQNRRICIALEQNGEAFEEERLIEHWAYFPTPTLRQAFANEAEKFGYSIDAMLEPASPEDRFGIRLSCTGIPSFQNIDEITFPLLQAAQRCDGTYDGWGSPVCR